MNLSNNGFWAGLYRGARSVRNTFLHKPEWRADPYADRTDLCTFVRTIFVAAPVALVTNAATIGWIFFVLLFLGKGLFNNFYTVFTVVLWLAGGAIIIGVTIALLVGGTELSKKFAKSETVSVVKNVILSKKQKICPLISFTGEA